jgi:leader peptidase (prepilin peptidase) / N-methyltransferase
MGLLDAYLWMGGAVVLAAASGPLVPTLIRAVPEPREAIEPKTPYAEIGASPNLALRATLICAVVAFLINVGLALAEVSSQRWLAVMAMLLPLLPVLVALGLIDWQTQLLPRLLVLPATAYAVTAASFAALITEESADLIRGLIGLVLARSLFWIMWRIHAAGMGFGDVRLSALVGFVLAYLGWSQFLIGTYAGFLLLGVPGVIFALAKRSRAALKLAVPFGPFMLIGALLGIVLGPALANYL